MISVIEQPKGYVLEDAVNEAAVTDSSGDALFTDAGHGLGDYVYIISDVEGYNGFWKVDTISPSTFKIQDADDNYIQFYQGVSVNYQKSISEHGWSALHLPITYKLRSDRYPVNTSDTTRTISSSSDDNGLTRLTISGSLGVFFPLMFVKISGTSVDGVYQVMEKYDTDDVTISLVYDGTILTGGEIVLYYSSYHIVVRVYAGGALASTLKFIPDQNNEVFFSVNEILKGHINQRNGLLNNDLPLNQDFFSQFYIDYAESYDESDGYTLTTFLDGFTQDTFVGYAINAVLAFKNKFSGWMSEYVFALSGFYGDPKKAKWLTNFSPSMWPSYFFDLSFIKNVDGEFRVDVYVDDVLDSQTVHPDQGQGVYRIPVEPQGSQVCVEVIRPQQTIDPPPDPTVGTFGSATQSGTGPAWALNPSPLFWRVVMATGETSPLLLYEITGGIANIDYIIGFDLEVTAAMTVRIRLYDETLTQSVEQTVTATGVHTGNRTLTPGFVPKYLAWRGTSPLGGVTLDIYPFTFSPDTGDPEVVPESDLTERICIEVDNECYEDSIYLTWLNNLGGFDYWLFTAEKDYLKDITSSLEKTKNVLPAWPKSYGETADTIRSQTERISREQIVVRSGYISKDQLENIARIKESLLVQILTSRQDRRTVIVDNESFSVWTDEDELFQVQFTITFTNDNPSQRA